MIELGRYYIALNNQASILSYMLVLWTTRVMCVTKRFHSNRIAGSKRIYEIVFEYSFI